MVKTFLAKYQKKNGISGFHFTLFIGCHSKGSCYLLSHVAYFLKNAIQVLFPQGDFIVTGRHGQNGTCRRPRDSPDHILKCMSLWSEGLFPPGCAGGLLGPNEDRLVLRASGNVGDTQTNAGCPGHIADPVAVSF